MSKFVYRVIVFLILSIFIQLRGKCAFAIELPVLVNTVKNAKVMLIIDDSGSMASIVEHKDFNPKDPQVLDTSKKIPAIIFRNESGPNPPTANDTLRPVLIEYNYLYTNVLAPIFGNNTGYLFETGTLNTAANIDSIRSMGCSFSLGFCCAPIGPCNIYNITGINNAVLFSNPSIKGSSVFSVSNLAKNGSSYVTDSNGNEYLYVDAYANSFYTTHFDWSTGWPNFDSSGNNQVYKTRVFSTTGGTVVFNGREVFLSAGLYRIEYLRWIFYVATPEQLANLPGTSRIQLVKDVVTDIINNNPSVQFGIATLNGTKLFPGVHGGILASQWYAPEGQSLPFTYGKIRKPIGTPPDELIDSLDLIGVGGATPLANTYIEVLRYFNGESANDPYCTICNYTSPITSECDGHFAILLTDGLPSGETANSFNGNWINDADGDGEEGVSNNHSCTSSVCAEFLDDAAYIAYNTDFKGSLSGTQNVVSYAIGMGLDFDLLDDFAENGGSGSSYLAETADEVAQTLQQIVNTIITTPVSGAGVAVAEAFGSTGKVFRPRFRADVWSGGIDVFSYTKDSGLTFLFDMGDKLEERDITLSPRTIIAGYDPDNDGDTNQTVAFSTSNASLLKPHLFELYYSGERSASELAEPLQNYTEDSSAIALINYIHGLDQNGLRKRDIDNDGKVEKLGDIVYSRPAEVDFKNGNYDNLTGYAEFVSGIAANQKRILLVGANDGMLHAFDSNTGEELWAYIPSSQLKYLERLAHPQYNTTHRRAFVDGDVAVEDVYINGEWKTIAMFGLRTGGSTYTVLDITDRENPKLLFEVSDSNLYGESWSTPVVAVVNGPANSADPSLYSWFMVVGTGADKPSAGVNLVAYNLNSSAPSPIVIPLSTTAPAGTKTGDLAVSQNDADLNVDRLYVGTEEGNMYRVQTQGLPSSWTVTKMYSGSSTQPITSAPTLVLADNPRYSPSAITGIESIKLAVGVYWGTGRYEEPSDVTTYGTTTQRIFGVFDPVKTDSDDYEYTLSGITTTSLKNQSIGLFDVERGNDGIYRIDSTKNGFYIDLDTSINLTPDNFLDPVGMVIQSPVNVSGAVLFTTFLPNTGMCQIGGYGFLQAVNFRTGGGVIADYSISDNNNNPLYNGGIYDTDGDTDYDQIDLNNAYGKKLFAVLDAHVESVDLSKTNPYQHDGILDKNDIRLHDTNGGIEPTVSSIGNSGAPSSPAVLLNDGQIIIQPAYPETPSSSGGTKPSSSIPPPESKDMNIYNMPLKVLSYHTETAN